MWFKRGRLNRRMETTGLKYTGDSRIQQSIPIVSGADA